MPVPVHRPDIGPTEAQAVTRCLDRGEVSGRGQEVRDFERELAAWVGRRHAVATASGTTALELTWLALGVGPGDEVVVPSFSFAPCADAVRRTGATVVYADVDPRTYGLSTATVTRLLTARTRAVLAVSMYGQPCALADLEQLCADRGVILVEDGAQSLGATHQQRAVGTFGLAGCLSFYANKLLACGEGGAVLTDDGEFADRLRLLRSNGVRDSPQQPYLRVEPGTGVRMGALAAAVGRAQLARAQGFLTRRQKHAERYAHELGDVVEFPARHPDTTRHAHWANLVLVEDRVGLAVGLAERGIQPRGAYTPLHLLEPDLIDLPGCTDVAARGLVLPSGNGLTDDDVAAVISAVRAVVRRPVTPSAS